MLADEVHVVEILFQNHLGEGEAQCCITPRVDRSPQIGVDSGRIQVRCDRDHFGTVITRLGDEMGIGNLRIGWIPTPDQDQIRVETIVC